MNVAKFALGYVVTGMTVCTIAHMVVGKLGEKKGVKEYEASKKKGSEEKK